MDKAEHKIKLEEAKVEAAKVAAQATLLHAMNESAEAKVTKMEDDAKAWYKMARARIMREMLAEAEPLASTTPVASSAEPPAATIPAASSKEPPAATTPAVVDDSPPSSM